MYISLYRRYRPQKFSDMVGQSAAVSVLGESLKEGHLGHAYLLSGPRGCGKTSAARIVAKSLICQNQTEEHEPCGMCSNCNAIAAGEHLDVIEIDGASNRGIGEIRDLKSHVNLKPLSAAYKVYIIDEVHMLTEPAFNALLKTLEEPPANVVFLLATTEPHKVPVTIRSRCQHIPFHRISLEDLVKRVAYVCECENVTADMEAVWEIARQADGALRDALSLTEQAIVLGRGSLTMDSVKDLTGGSNRAELERWITSLRTNPQKAASDLHAMLARGTSPERLTESLFAVFRDLWIFSMWSEKGVSALEISESEIGFLKEESLNWNAKKLRSACMLCNRILPRTRYGMRMEVFSGLLMIELMNIIDAEAARENQVRPAVPVPHIKPEEEKKDIPQKTRIKEHGIDISEEKHNSFEMPPQQKLNQPIAVKIEQEPSAASSDEAACSELISELGENDFSTLLSKLGGKSLPIGAALLNCEIVSNESGWNLLFPKASPSESYLMTPQNRKHLASAIYDLWKIRDSEDPEFEPSEPPAFTDGNSPEGVIVNDHEEAEAKSNGFAAGSADRIIKLLGAELLYVKDANSDREDVPIEFNE